MPSNMRFVISVLSACSMILGASGVSSQTYPYKPIRIVAAPIGGNGDLAARLLAGGISGPLGQPVIVENRPAILIPEIVATAPPDGYTILYTGSAVWIVPFLQKVNYDPLKDFAPVTLAASAPDVLVVSPSLPANSVKELIALAKSKPGELNYGSAGTGGSAHLDAELFKSLAGVNIVRVSYKGGQPQQITGLIAGEVHLVFASPVGAAPFIKSGRLKALAVTSAQPFSHFPGLPTMAAFLPGFEQIGPFVILAPAKTPATVIHRLNQEIVRTLNQADVKEKLFNAGVDIVGSSPVQAMAFMKADMTRMGKVIKEAGIKVE